MTMQPPASEKERVRAAEGLRKIQALIDQEKKEDARARNWAVILTFTLLGVLFGWNLYVQVDVAKLRGAVDSTVLIVSSLLATLSLALAYHFGMRQRHSIWRRLGIGIGAAGVITLIALAVI